MCFNSSLSEKISGFTSDTYEAVTGLAYDATNNKIGLKVGADTVIPFSSSFNFTGVTEHFEECHTDASRNYISFTPTEGGTALMIVSAVSVAVTSLNLSSTTNIVEKECIYTISGGYNRPSLYIAEVDITKSTSYTVKFNNGYYCVGIYILYHN